MEFQMRVLTPISAAVAYLSLVASASADEPIPAPPKAIRPHTPKNDAGIGSSEAVSGVRDVGQRWDSQGTATTSHAPPTLPREGSGSVSAERRESRGRC